MTEQQSRDVVPNQDLQETWSEICESLRAEIGEASYQSWIKPMRLIGKDGNAVRTGVPTRFMREWIQAHYQDRLSELLGGRGLSGGLDVV
ncbi:MAG: DnaA N-terminal domain-containing protein, partial [Rhodospirillales bacterium]